MAENPPSARLAAWFAHAAAREDAAARGPGARQPVLETLELLAVLRPREGVAGVLLERACGHLRAAQGALLAPAGESAADAWELLASCGREPAGGAPLWAAAREALASGKSALGADLWGAGAAAAGPRAAAAPAALVPLGRGGSGFGVLCLGWPAGGAPPAAVELGLLEALASYAAIAFENAGELERRAERDALTAVANHGRFWRVLEREALRAERYRSPLSVVLLDLDRFKQLNDRHGHLAGDRALAQVAAALVRSSRTSDLVARYGGEEFAVVLPQTALEGALACAQKCVAVVRELGLARDAAGRGLTASAGAAERAPGELPRALVARADAELYRAKRAGGDAVSP